MHRVVKKSDEDTRKITLPAVSLGSKVLAVTSGMSISAVRGQLVLEKGGGGSPQRRNSTRLGLCPRPVHRAAHNLEASKSNITRPISKEISKIF